MTREIDKTPVGQHTRLPWAYRPNEHDDWGTIRGADGFPVASTCASARQADDWQPGDTERNHIGPPEIKANAEFIVRACNSHEALTALARRVVEIFQPMQDKGQNGATFEALLERAKSCLETAEGGAP